MTATDEGRLAARYDGGLTRVEGLKGGISLIANISSEQDDAVIQCLLLLHHLEG